MPQKKDKHVRRMKLLPCAICGNNTDFTALYKSTFNKKHLRPDLYISRRLPDRVHFRLIRCKKCNLVFSSPIYDEERIVNLYKQSDVPLMEDLGNSSGLYAKYLTKILEKVSKDKFLDIGCGNGFFLEKVKTIGFSEAWGVEPSINSIKHLPKLVDKKKIIVDVFKKKYFQNNFFDVISFFQVLDHVIDPSKFLKDCFDILKPGGYIIAIMHDVAAPTHRLLGEKSPIFDIQHIYLFDKSTIRKIIEKNGFEIESISTAYTTYSLGYWLRMSPIPNLIKSSILKLPIGFLFKQKISFPAGNMAIIAKKPHANK